jgi:hypothetical protein
VGEVRNAYNIVGKLFGRPRRRWDNNINIDVKEKRCKAMDWTKLAHDRVQ